MMKYSVLFITLAASADALAPIETYLRRRLSPINSCASQAACLTITGDGENGDDTCSADGKRTVCMVWNNDGGSCVKDTSDSVSHACPVVDGVLNNDLNVKTESWDDGNQICVTVNGGETAVFGVKDGEGCSGSGDYSIAGGDRGICSGPLTACQGGNSVECAWTFPTSACPSSTTDDGEVVPTDDTDTNTGGRTCFSSEDKVQMESGEMKHFKDLSIGDSILSANRDGEMSYSKVVFLPHGENHVPTNFVNIKTQGERVIKMTRRHLLPLCSGKLMVAQDLKEGDCLRTVDGDAIIATVGEVEVNGVYTAVTENEFIVVNGIIASPFASPDGTKHAIFNQTDVNAWCASNNWLVYEHEHYLLQKSNESKEEEEESAAADPTTEAALVAPSNDCEEMLEKLYVNYKDEPVGWGVDGWGYTGWKNPSSRPQQEKINN